jgi:hypothetical protein
VQVRLTDKGKNLHAKTGCLTEVVLHRSELKVQKMIALNRQVQALRDALIPHLGEGMDE